MKHSRRAAEGTLLLFASLILLLGFALVFAAKLPEMRAENAVNINTAEPAAIAGALMVDDALGKLVVDYRESHGPFPNTASLARVPLLSEDRIRSLLKLHEKGDISRLTPGQLSARAGLDSGVASRLVDVLAEGRVDIGERGLSRIPVIGSDAVPGLDHRLRVRDPGPVALSFWAHAVLLLIGFFVFHSALKRRGPGADPYLLPCVLLLAGLGAIIMFSIKNPLRDTGVFPMQVQGVLIGLAFAAIPISARYRSLKPWRYMYLYALLAVFLTLMLTLFGTGPGGVRLRILGFQPVEVIKIALAFFVASYLADRWSVLIDQSGPRRRISLPLFRDIGPLAVMYLLSLATFVLLRDLGPMLVLFGMFVALLYAATGKPTFVAAGVILVGATGFVAHLLRLGVFDVRVDMWLHPWANPHPNGLQLGQALWGFGTGGIWGSGLGLGRPDFMSRSGSDLVFASAGEELGLIGSLFILLIFGVLIARGFRAAIRARTDFDRFLAAGVTSLLGIQTLVIVFGVLGLTPLTGVSLPFVSYGKSSMIASFFMLGLLLNVSSSGAGEVHPNTRRALAGLATGMLVLLLGVAGIARLTWIQGVRADYIAGNTVSTPDADGFVRPHVNPRLKAIEASIPRGTIYDRNGRILAASDDEKGPRARRYPYGASLAHLVGYLDPRCGGPVGMEKWRNGDLRGFDHYSALLPLYRHSHTPYRPKIEGRDVRLTIDAELQETVEKALRKHAGAVRDRRTGERKHKAAAVVIDVYTGEVLAAASIPNFDPNDLTPGRWKQYNRDPDALLVDRALNGVYPPGSTFKLVTAAAALENGVDYSYTCRHQDQKVRWQWKGKTYSRKRITDLEEMAAHGETGLAKAIRVSCNVFFARLGIELGPEKLYRTARSFSLRRIPPPAKLAEDLPDNAYGQGTIQVSPLEMARVVAAIANGGVMMKPHFVKEIRLNGQTVEMVEPEEMGRPLSPESAAALRKMMADVISSGTGRGVFSGLGISVAGKTGSAENDQADKRPHSWFVGFAPVEDPRIAFAVVVENGGYGRQVAGPVCREIVRAAF